MARSRKSFFNKVMQASSLAGGDRVALPGPEGNEEVPVKKIEKVCLGWCEGWYWDPDKTQLLAASLLPAGEGKLAYELLRRSHKEFPKNLPLMSATAEMALAANLPDRAKYEYSELRKRRPNDEKVIVGLAMAYDGLGDDSNSISLLLEAIEQAPASLPLWEALLHIQLAHGVEDEVLINFREISQHYGDMVAPLLTLAHYNEEKDNKDEARQLLESALSKKGDDVDVLRSCLRHGNQFSDPELVRRCGEELLRIDIFDEQDLESLFKAHIALQHYGDAQAVMALFQIRFPEYDLLPLKRKLIVATRPKVTEDD